MDVANELLSHFEDGLRCGKDAEKLIRDFGDPLIAAQLIRSSKIRNRSMTTKLLYGGIWGFLAFVLSYFGLTAFYHAGKANPAHDYYAEFNASALAVPSEQAAWPIYRAPFAKFGFSEGGGGKFDEIYLKRGDDYIRLVNPADGGPWQTAINKLEESAELLDAFRAARLKSHLGLPLYADRTRYSDEDRAALYPNRDFTDENTPAYSNEIVDKSMIAILLPHYQPLRTATRILTVDTRWAIEQGDFERVTQNVEAIFGISRQLGNEQILIGDLVAFAIQSMGFEVIDEILPAHLNQFNEDQLERMQTAVANTDPARMIDLTGERLMALDILQRCFTDDGSGDGRITKAGYDLIVNYNQIVGNQMAELGSYQQIANAWSTITAPVAMMQFPGRKEAEQEYLEFLEAREAELKKPYYAVALLKPDDEPEFQANAFLKFIFPSVQGIGKAMFRTKAQQEATATAISIYRFQKQKGQLPRSLTDLQGDFIEQLPIDQFTGQPLRYRVNRDRFELYSVGIDRMDNGGKRKRMPVTGSEAGVKSDSHTQESDKLQPTGEYSLDEEDQGVDWVLWPRLSENGNR